MLGIVGVKLLRNVEMKRWQMLTQNADKCWNKKHLGKSMANLDIPKTGPKKYAYKLKKYAYKNAKRCAPFFVVCVHPFFSAGTAI